ncbi:hypothetical protein M9H77_20088 [Catharanthus roseus]|uniref:Uncharacterized protein n=1 Tax=Catharanthus roseus TaxID=4058 RepID=A0ACC0AK57_CATRO|nr:hypothetical protein M9H77_20088 [Catharanthus roseus]
MYGKCISISYARQLFDEITERNAVVWNSMISLYAHSNNVSEALELFQIMDVMPSVSSFNSIIAGLLETKDGFLKAIAFYRRMLVMGFKPNSITVLALLRASSGVAALNFIKEIHAFSIRNYISLNPQVGSGTVEAYGKCGCLNSGLLVFNSMNVRDVVAWSSLISAYALQGEAKIALETFSLMEMAKVKPDGITFLAVLKACSHAGLADEAWMYFTQMQNFYGVAANSDHYACLVDVLSRAGRLYEAYEVIKGMPVKVIAKAWGALLGACRIYGELELGKIAGQALFELEPENPANYVLLAKLYASLGRPEEAQRITREMKERASIVSKTIRKEKKGYEITITIYIGRNRGRSQIYPKSKSNNTIYNATAAGIIWIDIKWLILPPGPCGHPLTLRTEHMEREVFFLCRTGHLRG